MSGMVDSMWERGHLKFPRLFMKLPRRLRQLIIELWYLAVYGDRVDPRTGILLCKGQLFTTYSSLAARLETTTSKIKSDLATLASMDLLHIQSTNRGVVITLFGYADDSLADRLRSSLESLVDDSQTDSKSPANRSPSGTKQRTSSESSPADRSQTSRESLADDSQIAGSSLADRHITNTVSSNAVIKNSLPAREGGAVNCSEFPNGSDAFAEIDRAIAQAEAEEAAANPEREKARKRLLDKALEVVEAWVEICVPKGWGPIRKPEVYLAEIAMRFRTWPDIEDWRTAMQQLVRDPYHSNPQTRCSFHKFLTHYSLFAELIEKAESSAEPSATARASPSNGKRGRGTAAEALANAGDNQPSFDSWRKQMEPRMDTNEHG